MEPYKSASEWLPGQRRSQVKGFPFEASNTRLNSLGNLSAKKCNSLLHKFFGAV